MQNSPHVDNPVDKPVENTGKPFNVAEFYAEANKKLKNRAFLDDDAETQRRLNELELKKWRRRVNPIDLAYADALALGGWEFFVAYTTGAAPDGTDLPPEFATSILKALRKREALHEAKLIQAVLINGAISQGGKKTKKMIDKADSALNEEAKE